MPVLRVTPEEASHLLAEGDFDLVDVREPDEWALGHMPGARHVPLGQLMREPSRHLRHDRVIFVCGHGVRSLTAAQIASKMGYDRVFSVDGGIASWSAAGFPVERS
ncbi:MAG TPA: rhodanese-like domain-containing protein [Anaeromyxobacteraceae bacterium]|nr:rhodanese-like domain-containing protein [Anaeromyxobacteraceae bacterium]